MVCDMMFVRVSKWVSEWVWWPPPCHSVWMCPVAVKCHIAYCTEVARVGKIHEMFEHEFPEMYSAVCFSHRCEMDFPNIYIINYFKYKIAFSKSSLNSSFITLTACSFDFVTIFRLFLCIFHLTNIYLISPLKSFEMNESRIYSMCTTHTHTMIMVYCGASK